MNDRALRIPTSAGKRSSRSTLLWAVALQVAILSVTALVVVKQDAPEAPPVFSGERVVSVEQEEATRPRERVRELNRRMAKPRSFQPLAVEAAFQTDAPALPALPETDFDVSEIEESLLAQQGRFSEESLANWAASLGSGASAAEFFGVKDSGRRIVIVVNTSASVVRKASKRGVSIEEIQAEAAKLVQGLEGGTVFGIVQFSQGVRSFSEFLAPALAKNKNAAAKWIGDELRGNPPVVAEARWLGHEAALAAALELRPDLIFLVTDGSLNRRTPKAGGGYTYPQISYSELLSFVDRQVLDTGARPRLHVVGFELGEEERDGLQRLASRFKGTLREF